MVVRVLWHLYDKCSIDVESSRESDDEARRVNRRAAPFVRHQRLGPPSRRPLGPVP